MLPNTAMMANQTWILNPKEDQKNQCPAYASNQSDDGEKPKLWTQDKDILLYSQR